MAAGFVGYYAMGLRGADLAGAIFTGVLIGGIIGAGIVAAPAAWAAGTGWLAAMAANVVVGVAAGTIEEVVSHFVWEGGGTLAVSVGAASGLLAGAGTRLLGKGISALLQWRWLRWVCSAAPAFLAKVQRMLPLARLVPVRYGFGYLGERELVASPLLSAFSWIILGGKHVVYGVTWTAEWLRTRLA